MQIICSACAIKNQTIASLRAQIEELGSKNKELREEVDKLQNDIRLLSVKESVKGKVLARRLPPNCHHIIQQLDKDLKMVKISDETEARITELLTSMEAIPVSITPAPLRQVDVVTMFCKKCGDRIDDFKSIDLNNELEKYERMLIAKAFAQAGGVKSQAAESLNLNRTTLIEKMKRLKMP
jgi:transcriptional regulator of acetoin/glycerol metabolism